MEILEDITSFDLPKADVGGSNPSWDTIYD